MKFLKKLSIAAAAAASATALAAPTFPKSEAEDADKIMSKEYSRINEAISKNLDRGTTLMHTTTGYMHREYPMILTVISNRELNALNKLVTDIDPNAFMVINRINEVKGRGFSLQKKYR